MHVQQTLNISFISVKLSVNQKFHILILNNYPKNMQCYDKHHILHECELLHTHFIDSPERGRRVALYPACCMACCAM